MLFSSSGSFVILLHIFAHYCAGHAQVAACPALARCLRKQHFALQAALKRLQLDYVDLVFCHRPDAFTPVEETVRAMNFVIDQGWAFYWGTSEWTAQQITEVLTTPSLPEAGFFPRQITLCTCLDPCFKQ